MRGGVERAGQIRFSSSQPARTQDCTTQVLRRCCKGAAHPHPRPWAFALPAARLALTPMGLPMPRRYSTCALSSCRVRSPHHRKWPLQPYHRPVVESSRVSASS